MAAQNGKDLLIKLDLTGGGLFTTIAGLRSHADQFQRRDSGCHQPGEPGRMA